MRQVLPWVRHFGIQSGLELGPLHLVRKLSQHNLHTFNGLACFVRGVSRIQELEREYDALKENDPAELQKAISLTEVG